MVAKIFFLLIIFVVYVNTVKSECDSYSGCVVTFISGFFSSVNYFKNVERDDLNDTLKYGEDALNNILLNVSTFLQSEWDGTNVSHIFQNVDNDTTIYVREIGIADGIDLDDDDLYNNIFYLNDTFEIPKEVNAQNINFTIDEIISISKINSFKNHTPVIQPLVFNFSEILTPMNFSASLFPQIKIEHFQSINKNDQHVNEVSDIADFQEYYDFNEDNSTDYPVIDYIDLYRDTTNEVIDTKPTERYENGHSVDVNENNKGYVKDSLVEVEKYEDNGLIYNKDNTNEDITRAIFPWLAAIFVRNETSDQFRYHCDGALLTDTVILTAARCIQSANSSVTANDMIVLLGKNSLQTTGDSERVKRIEAVHVHENFTGGRNNDLAILALGGAVEFSDSIQPAQVGDLKEYDDAFTTGWAFTGELSLIQLQKGNKRCEGEMEGNHTVCAGYDTDVTVCPSYGGLYVVEKNKTSYLRGLRTADPTDREVCINKPITFTALEPFSAWLSHFIS